MGLNWLITGGCGFIGRNLISDLLNEGGHSIRVVDNLSVGTLEELCSVASPVVADIDNVTSALTGVEFVEADIRSIDAAMQVCSGIDVVVHLAANTGVGPSVEDPLFDCHSNVLGTLNYLESSRQNGVKKFIFASSGAPAGEVEPPIHEEIVPKPVSPYGASKLAGEGYCSSYSRCFELDTVALRFGNVYGPLSVHKSSVVAKFINQALSGEPLCVFGDGTQTRDFIYVGDLIQAIKSAANTPGIGGEIFQIATSEETTIQNMMSVLVQELQNHGVAEPTIKYTESRLGDVKRNYSDTSKAKAMLNWESKTNLKEGISKTIQYFLEQK